MPTLSEGTQAVRLAREAIRHGFSMGGREPDVATAFRTVDLPPLFEERRGVFVTLTDREGLLRGCVGFAVPLFPLRAALPRAAWAAAVEDPRFPPLAPRELERTRIEVSLLSMPEELRPGADLPGAVAVGRDGLIVSREGFEGLLLPQVAAQQGWDASRFLSETCRKAGLPPDAWSQTGTRVLRFQADLFREREPGGPAESHPLP